MVQLKMMMIVSMVAMMMLIGIIMTIVLNVLLCTYSEEKAKK